MKETQDPCSSLLQKSWQSLQDGDKVQARRQAEQALAIAPDREEPWLILAAVASPRASITYLNRALQINPDSRAAKQGLQWATERLKTGDAAAQARRVTVVVAGSNAIVRNRQLAPLFFLVILAALTAGLLWFRYPVISLAGAQQGTTTPIQTAPLVAYIVDPTPTIVVLTQPPLVQPLPATELPTEIAILVPPTAAEATGGTDTPALETETALPTATQLPVTPVPTEKPTTEPTTEPTQQPKKSAKNNKKKKKKVTVAQAPAPEISPGGRWIDVDLSDQRTYAYDNDQLVRSFVVSTGTWQYPTVTGTYRIYVKYRAADMSGPDYYLPDVPYVMYFYKGYGLHGTYWHNNFGTPMSHGCVNLSTEDAGWLFDFATVGTIVHVHQ